MSDKFLKVEAYTFLFLNLICLLVIFLEGFVFGFRYFEVFLVVIFFIYFPLLLFFFLVLFYQLCLAFLVMENTKLKVQITLIEILFIAAIASEIMISTKMSF
jgi:hypothetical protein